ncbi:hypothetical protein B0T21DRAFT_353719 [Apiosordaria backusii]|uniref:Uncharacterized protein n=1 Tax=Apiosordaria backusii TaxID=314023 RepID=A0AA39ZPT0_9PEZI|nr:hypothetical protein B0T21DRAFT_353719 [Apiosordaria backusii]
MQHSGITAAVISTNTSVPPVNQNHGEKLSSPAARETVLASRTTIFDARASAILRWKLSDATACCFYDSQRAMGSIQQYLMSRSLEPFPIILVAQRHGHFFVVFRAGTDTWTSASIYCFGEGQTCMGIDWNRLWRRRGDATQEQGEGGSKDLEEGGERGVVMSMQKLSMNWRMRVRRWSCLLIGRVLMDDVERN